MGMKFAFLKQFDTLICHYLGLDTEVTKINRLHNAGKGLQVAQTSGFKRHNMKSSWSEFTHLEAANLEQFGHEIGAAVANHLVISFNEPKIRKGDHV
jgi:hypothetical protein